MKNIALSVSIALFLTIGMIMTGCGQSADDAEKIAQDFVINSPTFQFDGIQDSLELVSTETEAMNSWVFTYQFESRNAGYGDRTGEALNTVITSHEAVINVEHSIVESAVMDDQWDMLKQQMLASTS